MHPSGIRYTAIFILLILLSPFSYADNRAQYALIITIDGLRPDAIDQADTPNLDLLIKNGSYTPEAKTDEHAKTLPSHTSLVTGLTSARHGMTKNKNSKDLGHIKTATIFSIAKNNGLGTAMFVGKNKLTYLNAPGTLDRYESTNESKDSVEQITQSYSSYMKQHRPALTLIHFPYPDLTGHRKGWMSAEYLDSIGDVDRALGSIIQSLKEAGIFDSVFIVITSDHGGEGDNHGRHVPSSIKIPWLAVGENVKEGYRINERVYIHDTAPTVLHALGLTPPPNIDGHVIKEIFVEY